MKDTLNLKDGSVIELESGAALDAMTVLSDDYDAMVATWKLLTSDNLSEVTVKNSSDLVVGSYTNLVLVNETSTVNSDGTISTVYNFREKTDIELQIEAIEAEQEIQDEAIEELASVVAGEETEGTESTESTESTDTTTES